jgi:hypothetical protein
MNQKELRQEPELPEGVIRRHGSLRTLKTEKTTSNVGFLDHRNVVGTVPDGQRHSLAALLDLAG